MNVLITGGSGTFGRAFAKTAIGKYQRICIYSRGEHAQAEMRDAMGDHQDLRWFIGDVRDRDRLRRAMEGCEHVVHAAALKRIEVGAYDCIELIKTNIVGSMNVVEAAADAGVQKVVALSTDKAWRGGVSPYGHSKALAESLFIQANKTAPKVKFAAVRYGNIWRSRGSVVPKWEAMIAAGAKEVPVTDADCTRFMMRQEEAVALVLDTLQTMEGGELAIPDWLPAYRLGDLAEAMGVAMRVTGLPDWERKHEGMREGLTSDIVRRLTVNELRDLLRDETPGTSRP